MLDPISGYQAAQLKYQDRLQEAEVERLYRQLRGNQPGLLKRINHHFKAAIQWMKPQAKPNLAGPYLDGS